MQVWGKRVNDTPLTPPRIANLSKEAEASRVDVVGRPQEIDSWGVVGKSGGLKGGGITPKNLQESCP